MKAFTKRTNEERNFVILTLTNDYIEFNRKHMEPLMNTIASELQCLYPKMEKTDPIDWACELVSSSNKEEIDKVMNQIDSIYM